MVKCQDHKGKLHEEIMRLQTGGKVADSLWLIHVGNSNPYCTSGHDLYVPSHLCRVHGTSQRTG